MREMTAAGEVHALVAERVWQELSRGLMSQRPSRMLQVLDQAHALRILLPHLPAPDTQPDWLKALDASAAAHDPLPVRFAILLAGMTIPKESRIALGHQENIPQSASPTVSGNIDKTKAAKSVTEQAKALRASNECTDAAARLVSEIPGPIPQAARQWFLSPERQDAEALLALFNRHDAWRRPERLRLLMTVAQRLALPDHPAQTVAPRQAIPPTPGSDSTQLFRREKGDSPSSPLPVDRLSRTVSHNSVSNIIQGIEQALGTAAAVDTGAIARQHQANPTAIRSAIDDARREAISGYLVSRS
jgi:multifunctional CCA protein